MRRRRLGQHVLVDPKILRAILDSADIQGEEIVYEIGAGTGELTARLCELASRVISTEIDPQLYRIANHSLSQLSNLQLMNIDGFEFDGQFDILVSNLPYSESSHFIQWLATKRFRRAVVTLQREFVQKLKAKPGSRNYRAISALAQAVFNLKSVMNFGRSAFRPRPRVDASLIVIEPRFTNPLTRSIESAITKLFAFRGRLVSSALRNLAKHGEEEGIRGLQVEQLSSNLLSKRIENLEPSEALLIASALEKRIEQR